MRDSLYRIGAMTASGLDQPLGDLGETRLIEEAVHGDTSWLACVATRMRAAALEMGDAAPANKRI